MLYAVPYIGAMLYSQALQPLLRVGQDFFVGQSASDSPNFLDVHVRVSHTVGVHCLLALLHDSVGSRGVTEGRVQVFHDLRPFRPVTTTQTKTDYNEQREMMGCIMSPTHKDK
jgi:hypothetical protein